MAWINNDKANRNYSRLCLLALCLLSAFVAEARTALVIGNGAYRNDPLVNPLNDAADMAATLRELGFSVIHKQNLDERGLIDALREFAEALNNDPEAGLFYYAGHGAEVGGRNYLLPIGFNIQKESEVEFEALDVQRVLRSMEETRSKLNIVIVDACRNNPFGRGFQRAATTRGLGRMEAPVGSLIASSTASGDVAADGSGRNSPYTRHLLTAMRKPGLTLEQVFKEVRRQMLAETGKNKQIPWESTSLTGDFYFVPATLTRPEPVISPTPAPTPDPTAAVSRLLAACQAHLAANRLTSGAGGTALGCYQDVLKLDPANGEALRGLDMIAERYISWAEEALQRSEQAKAAAYLERLGQVSPEHPKLGELRGRLTVASAPAVVAVPSRPQGEFRDRLRSGGEGPAMMVIPAGEFVMGSPASEEGRYDDEKQHRVQISKPFAMGKYEVTFAEYDQFAEATGRAKPADEGWGRGNRPVINVSWEDAVAYAKWLSQQTGQNYRLPTEAEWEYAARGGRESAYWWGNSVGRNNANCDGCGSQWDNRQTAPVGSFAANSYGLHDTAGNVWEWCQDVYIDDIAKSTVQVDPIYTSGSAFRVLRGGSWYDYPHYLRAASRGDYGPAGPNRHHGFRLARTVTF